MKKQIKNIRNLRETLISELETFYNDGKSQKGLETLDVISKTSSAIIRSAKVEMEYAKFKGMETDIEFLSPETKAA